MNGLQQLQLLLRAIVEHDTDYPTRNSLVMLAFAQAHAMGLSVGIRVDSAEPEWPVIFIELPTGQVSWHVPQHERAWDGHSTAEKHARIADFLASFATSEAPSA